MWGNVKNLVDGENHSHIENAVDDFSHYIHDITGYFPSKLIIEGIATETIKKTLKQHPEIRILVLGVSTNENPGPLVKELTSGKTRLHIPITLVPGDISIKELEMLS